MEAVALNDQPPNHGPGSDDNPVVAVSFQKNPHHIRKYLEAEPKALGVTQITLSIFQISLSLSTFITSTEDSTVDTIHVIGSLFVIVAGSVALAAQNLQLPTLRACLGMQVLACVVSVLNIFLSMLQVGHNYASVSCWMAKMNSTDHGAICEHITTAYEFYYVGGLLIHSTILAICATLAAYCCKVINCCTPTSKTPVITINIPPAPQ